MLLTLFTAILCSNFTGLNEEEQDEKEKESHHQGVQDTTKQILDEFLYFLGYRLTVGQVYERKLRRLGLTSHRMAKDTEDSNLDILSATFGIPQLRGTQEIQPSMPPKPVVPQVQEIKVEEASREDDRPAISLMH